MNEKIKELLESLKINEFIASSEILEYLDLDPTQKNFKLLRVIMLEYGFKASAYKGKKGYRKLEIVADDEEEIEIVPVEEKKIDENDNKFLHNLDRCIDYLSHMKLNSDNIDDKVDEIINKFKKNYLFEVK